MASAIEYQHSQTAVGKRKWSRKRLLFKSLLVIVILFAGAVALRHFIMGNTTIRYFGRVIDINGQPLGNVEVAISVIEITGVIQGPWHPPSSRMERFCVTTDGNGRFSFRGYGRRIWVSPDDHNTYQVRRGGDVLDYGATDKQRLPTTVAKEVTIVFGPSWQVLQSRGH